MNLDLFQGPNFVAGLVYKIKLRNKLISIIDEIVSSNTCYKSINFQEELQKLLGYDWFLLFMKPNVQNQLWSKLVKYCLLFC